jgi:hypothetical protein
MSLPSPGNDLAPKGLDGPPSPSEVRKNISTTDEELRRSAQELGMIGRLFGSRYNAPINIAGMLVLLGFFGMLLGPFLPIRGEGFSIADFEKSCGALIISAITFLGGYLGGGKSDSGD